MKTALLIPGQGSYTETIISELVEAYPEFQTEIAAASSIYRKYFGKDLSEIVFNVEPHQAIIENDFELSQVVIYLSGYLYQKVLAKKGVVPDLYVGHSIGEIAAFAAAGAVSFEVGFHIVCLRTNAVKNFASRGDMYALNCEPAKVKSLLEFLGDKALEIAVINGAEQTVVSGTTTSIQKLVKLLAAADIGYTKLKSDYPFHSQHMIMSVPHFYEELRKLRYNTLLKPVYSPILGRFYNESDNLASCLSLHLVQPLNFSAGLKSLYHAGVRNFVECSSRKALTNITNSTLGDFKGTQILNCRAVPGSVDAGIENVLSILSGHTKPVPTPTPVTNRTPMTPPPPAPQSPVTFPTPPVMATPASNTPTVPTMAPQTPPPPKPAPVAPMTESPSDIQARVLKTFKDLTNYPEEVLELDAHIESDLGLDSVKQIEIITALLKEFSIPAQQNIEVARYNTIRKTIEFVQSQLQALHNKAA